MLVFLHYLSISFDLSFFYRILTLNIFNTLAHAAIVAINEAIDRNDPDELFKVLSNPEARLLNLYEINKVGYQNKLAEEKARKTIAAEAKVR